MLFDCIIFRNASPKILVSGEKERYVGNHLGVVINKAAQSTKTGRPDCPRANVQIYGLQCWLCLWDKGQKGWVCNHWWGCSIFICHLTQLTTGSKSFLVIADVMGDFYLCTTGRKESSMLFTPPWSWLVCCSWSGKESHHVIYDEG